MKVLVYMCVCGYMRFHIDEGGKWRVKSYYLK